MLWTSLSVISMPPQALGNRQVQFFFNSQSLLSSLIILSVSGETVIGRKPNYKDGNLDVGFYFPGTLHSEINKQQALNLALVDY